MRLKNIPGAHETLIAHPQFVVMEPSNYKGKWNELFPSQQPIHIEIGMGRGQFIHTLAKQNPHINYIGIEKMSSVLYEALLKVKEEPLPNLYLVRMNVENITEVFEQEEVKRIYANFSDPWPKNRQAKRRLTHHRNLRKYQHILPKAGEFFFKTDNKLLFEFSLNELLNEEWKVRNVTLDLHQSQFAEENVMTEYEKKFSSKGFPIYRLESINLKNNSIFI